MVTTMRNVALLLAYDGGAYHGWQAQKNAVSVSRTLEEAISGALGHPVRLTGCGRTDAGVHAEYYVANFRTDSHIPPERMPYAFLPWLPKDISVYKAAYVPEAFHAVYSSVRKAYTYRVYPGKIPDPFYRGRAYFYPYGRLDVERMRRAAAHMIGTHDFSAMRTLGSNVKTTVRTLYAIEIAEGEKTLSIQMAANGFLYNMARTIAGTLLYVSEGKIDPDSIPDVLASGDRRRAGPNIPPEGLAMTGVWYREPLFD
ncbi:tRNA pseudouridine(38-40) synthase TruA [Oscillospiraceae bacterium OttesenSCG-928-F05]|nr:tRNA pseudouridine(38-40) synthase TruA [Oscillospiraceae bacterium OttesenSCG-928-F05]